MEENIGNFRNIIVIFLGQFWSLQAKHFQKQKYHLPSIKSDRLLIIDGSLLLFAEIGIKVGDVIVSICPFLEFQSPVLIRMLDKSLVEGKLTCACFSGGCCCGRGCGGCCSRRWYKS